jgi:hypothetical protein
MVLEEANRPVTVREGDKVFQIPAAQAVLRTTLRAGANGDAKVALKVLELIARAESGRASEALEMTEFLTKYKENLTPLFEQYERDGLDPPTYPHPYDIIFNELTGEFTIDGPKTKEEAGARRAVRELALKSMPRYFEVEAALKKDPSNRALRKELRELKKYHDFVVDDSNRNARHEALRISRRALEPKPDQKTTPRTKRDE